MPEKTEIQTVNLEALPDGSWVQLRTWSLNTPYAQIVSGTFDVDVLEKFCAGIRAALDEYAADTRRVPGRNDDAAGELIRATEHVLGMIARRRNEIQGSPEKLIDVIGAIQRHEKGFKAALKTSKKKSQPLKAA